MPQTITAKLTSLLFTNCDCDY